MKMMTICYSLCGKTRLLALTYHFIVCIHVYSISSTFFGLFYSIQCSSLLLYFVLAFCLFLCVFLDRVYAIDMLCVCLTGSSSSVAVLAIEKQ